MKFSPIRRTAAWRTAPAVLLTVLLGCGSSPSDGTRTVQPGAPGEPSRIEPAGDAVRSGYTEADVRFMQGMITHHAQALAMAALVPGRTEREQLHRLARRIEISQESELALMERWLERRGEPVPDWTADHTAADPAEHGRMPGMATPEEMARLADARGSSFDRLFLELMIRHHEGALVMVEELLATEGAGQEPELFQFAAHVDADQRAEIARMRALHDALSR